MWGATRTVAGRDGVTTLRLRALAATEQVAYRVQDRIEQGGPHMRQTKPPSIEAMERWIMDGIACATDGCRVEPDGECQHGAKSWLIVLGYI